MTSLLSFGLLALAGALPSPASTDHHAAVWAMPSHTVTVTYAERRGDLREATIRVVPSGDARPRWRGDVEALAVHGGEKHGWVVVDRLRAADGGLEARATLPGPEAIWAFAIRTSAEQTRIWTAPSARTGDDEPPKEPPPDEPPGGPPAEPPGEPPTDEPPPDDDIRDPWGDGDDDGDDGIRDPWGDEAVTPTSLRFSI